MIASFKHNFIFIKPKKTGGTTVEAVLSADCGPDDIITPLGARDELLRSGDGPLVCRNFAPPEIEKPWLAAIASRQFELLEKGKRRKVNFYAHMPAIEIRNALEEKFWENACKISIVRHPYEKAVSSAFYGYREKKHGAFEGRLDSTVREGNYTSDEFYQIEGRSVIDEYLHIENLRDDLLRVGAMVGISIPEELPRMKSKSRVDRRPAREILSDEQKEIIYNFCKSEFDQFGYER